LTITIGGFSEIKLDFETSFEDLRTDYPNIISKLILFNLNL
jgi:hypothetical protein